MKPLRSTRILSLALIACLACIAPAQDQSATPDIVQTLRTDAAALRTVLNSKLANTFLDNVASLPTPESRTIYRRTGSRDHISPAEWLALPEEDKKLYEPVTLPPDRFYTTYYGSPLAFSRIIELLSEHGADSLQGKRIMDFGYGSIGHLRILAASGAHAVGVDIDSRLASLYCEPADQGDFGAGSIAFCHGRWPAQKEVIDCAGRNYDIITSKNTLKRGYINPVRTPEPDARIDLGVDDETFLKALHEALKPGGLLVIYNICPRLKPEPEPYVPWADGASPWTAQQWQAAGFNVIAVDVDDTPTTRKLAAALKWNEQGMDIDNDLTGHYTILQRPTIAPAIPRTDDHAPD